MCYCDVCWAEWDVRDPGVIYLRGDGVFRCLDEVACFLRLATGEITPAERTVT